MTYGMLWGLVTQLHPILGEYLRARWRHRQRLRIANVLYYDQVSMVAASEYTIPLRKVSTYRLPGHRTPSSISQPQTLCYATETCSNSVVFSTLRAFGILCWLAQVLGGGRLICIVAGALATHERKAAPRVSYRDNVRRQKRRERRS